jgi:hypothetical protein
VELTRRLLRYGYQRPHVLLVEAPGAASVRYAAEQVLDERAWKQAASAADGDVLLVCGRAGPDLQEQVDRAWEQMPGPRARATARQPDDVARELDAARDRLHDLGEQRADAGTRPPAHDDETPPAGGEHQAAGHDMGDHDMGGHDMDGHDMGSMAMPGGLGMATTGPDRDGLALDVLHVQLGPVLPHWPAGLLAELSVQGDVVTAASLRQLDGWSRDAGDDRVQRLDRAAAVLALAGAERHARRVRRARDATLPAHELADLHRAVARDRVLRWSLARLPAVGADDLWTQLLGLLSDGTAAPVGLDAAAHALVGAELTAVRLALAAAPSLSAPDREDARA